MTSQVGSIVLIGPTGSGKTAVGSDLARALGWPFVELDSLRHEWYPEFGLDTEEEAQAIAHGGLLELLATWKPFELLSVERVMTEHPTDTVIAFGGGQSVYMDDAQIARAQDALAVASRVILLLPSDDPATCLNVLRERLRKEAFVHEAADPDAFLRDFTPILTMQIQSESNAILATETIVTGQSTPQEIARHITTTMPEAK